MIRAVLLALVLATPASAQPKSPGPPKPAPSAAQQLLADVEANYKKPQHLQATFDQVVTNAISDVPQPAPGVLYVQKPDKIRFDFWQPKLAVKKLKVQYLLDGKTFWMIDHKGTKYGKQAIEQSNLPATVAFFLGAGSLSRDFDVTSTKPNELVLTPKKPSAAYAKIVLVLDARKMVSQVTITGSSGNVQNMKFSDVVLDKPAPGGTFVLDPKTIAGWDQVKL